MNMTPEADVTDVVTSAEVRPSRKQHNKKMVELTPIQMYKIMALRFNSFVLEQKSIFPEFDEHDLEAQHIFIEEGQKIIAYARAFKSGDTSATFGRVVVDMTYRGQKLGQQIVEMAIAALKEIGGVQKIEIEAQEYLTKFYESFGFRKTSEPFDDAGIMHVSMELDI